MPPSNELFADTGKLYADTGRLYVATSAKKEQGKRDFSYVQGQQGSDILRSHASRNRFFNAARGQGCFLGGCAKLYLPLYNLKEEVCDDRGYVKFNLLAYVKDTFAATFSQTWLRKNSCNYVNSVRIVRQLLPLFSC